MEFRAAHCSPAANFCFNVWQIKIAYFHILIFCALTSRNYDENKDTKEKSCCTDIKLQSAEVISSYFSLNTSIKIIVYSADTTAFERLTGKRKVSIMGV